MVIGVDAMGGDNAPSEIVKGCIDFASGNPNVNIVLFGIENKIKECVKNPISDFPKNIVIHNTFSSITMEDDPMIIIKEKSDSSMAVGLKELKEGNIDAFVSAGSTGALHAGSTLLVRKIKGIKRSAIGTVLPFRTPLLMLDCGANPTVTPEILQQWSIVGSVYMKKMFSVSSPRIGLLNNGTEEHKGTETVQEAYQLLKNDNRINFVGNIEAKQIPSSPCDVLITDGFTGNITLKLIEGMGKMMFSRLKEVYSSNVKTKISYLMVKNNLKGLKNDFDSSEYGGAPFLGISKPVIKAHGSSKAKEIKSAIRQAVYYKNSNINDELLRIINE